MNFIKSIRIHTLLEEKLSYSFDNGDNTAKATRTLISIPSDETLTQPTNTVKLKTPPTAVSAKPMTFIRFDQFYLKSVIPWTPGLPANSNTTKYNQLLINTYFKIKPFKLQDLEIGYKESSKFN
jgi:hypothetical protein